MSTIAEWSGKHADLPRLEREVLLMDALEMSRATVIAFPEKTIDLPQLDRLNTAADRVRAGEPLAYVRGKKEFWGLDLRVTPDVLIPRPETEHLVELALSIAQPGDRLLDLGTGSGAIAIALAHDRRDLEICATDVSEEALRVAVANAEQHQLEIDFHQRRWLEGQIEPFDIIVTNPPYVADGDEALTALSHEPLSALASGADGLNDIREIIDTAFDLCRRALLIEHGADQGAATAALMRARGYEHVATHTDLAGLDRVTVGFRQ